MADDTVLAGRQPNTALEAPLWKLQSVNDGGLQLCGERPNSGKHQIPCVGGNFDAFSADARQRHDNEDFVSGFQDIYQRVDEVPAD